MDKLFCSSNDEMRLHKEDGHGSHACPQLVKM